MNILVTGAAGYIGSILTESLIVAGHHVVALDNLSKGHREAVDTEAVFIKADLADLPGLENIFRHIQFDAVMHLAADTEAALSMSDPGRFFRNNVINSINLADCMLKYNVNNLIFSSSAAVYGEVNTMPVTEESELNPVNAYGDSKFIFERMLRWYHEAHNLNSICLRYFNVAGASESLGPDRNPETSLIPAVINVAAGKEDFIPVFGNDYNTRDGTCIRDYIHVLDIARAHILALDKLLKNGGYRIYNLGNGHGFTVMEVIKAARDVTGNHIPIKIQPRRPGDIETMVASAALAASDLGWNPQYHDLNSIIESAWKWRLKYPLGYNEKRSY